MSSTVFKILSHACLWVKRGNTRLIIDPWLLGSCYWRSWWNYPEPDIDFAELKQTTHVLLSHIHWDHWHGLSLKKFFKQCQFIVPDEPKKRSYDDLVEVRLGDVKLM
jgi:UDP-MurNAc hydroxylase